MKQQIIQVVTLFFFIGLLSGFILFRSGIWSQKTTTPSDHLQDKPVTSSDTLPKIDSASLQMLSSSKSSLISSPEMLEAFQKLHESSKNTIPDSQYLNTYSDSLSKDTIR